MSGFYLRYSSMLMLNQRKLPKSHQSPENENVYKYDETNDIIKEGADVAKMIS